MQLQAEISKVRLDPNSIDMLKKLTTPKRPSFFSDRIKDFEDSFKENIGLVAGSLKEGDFEQVRFYAHKFKTAAGVMGANIVFLFCKEIEVLVKEKPVDYELKTKSVILKIIKETNEALKELKNLEKSD